jgi:hypothetical protein
MAAGIASVTPAVAAQARLQSPRVSIPFPGQLNGAAVTPAGTAWAVGYTTGEPLAERWNGKAWTRVSSPDPVPVSSSKLTWNILQGVAATSAGNAWAVGYDEVALQGSKTMILHWNGKAWKQVASPNPFCATCDSLYGVAAASARSAWAVGTVNVGGEVVILHWNGTRWANSTSANVAA